MTTELKHDILTQEFLYEEYVNNKKSINVISKQIKIATMTIYDAMIRHSIPIRKSKKYQIPSDILYIEYVENKKTIKEISDIFGCSFFVIQSLLKKYKIQARVGKNTNLIPKLSEDILNKLYVDDNLSIRQISNKLSLSERYISDSLKQFNIARKRSIKTSLKIDLTNKTIGRLTVISLHSIINNQNIWLCKCVCGNEIKVEARSLLDKNRMIKSCGCARANNSDWKIIPPYQWSHIVNGAIKRGFTISISMEYGENLFLQQNKKCALSGVELFFGRSRDKSQTTASLDRIDSNYGYIEGNVQWIHKILNIAKHTTTNAEYINWCKLVAGHNK
jgi:transposase